MRFTRHRGKVRADVDEVEARVLAQLAEEILALVEKPSLGDDPLAELVGLADEVAPPDDPVLTRLLPDAYRDDPAAAVDFRRYTDADLRRRKRDNATAVRRTLPEGGGRLELDRDQVDQWLECLNDMRLALGTALGVSDDLDPDDVEEEHPSYASMQVYGWLGWLQESLLSCTEPRVPHA
ncbi:MAG TPA: DUF2017 domain-containing protein [Mycobacteriales bacterium]|nr:DUF2017 domain-containing protein [Mycobacteriales bacterium]